MCAQFECVCEMQGITNYILIIMRFLIYICLFKTSQCKLLRHFFIYSLISHRVLNHHNHYICFAKNYVSLFQLDLQVAAVSPSNYTTVCSQMNVDVVARDVNDAPPAQEMHLVIAADVISNQSYGVLKNLAAALKLNGFILLEETAAQLNFKIALKQTDLVLIAKQTDSIGKTYLLLKKIEKKEEPTVIQITEKTFSWLEGVKAALKKSESEGQQVLLVSQGEPLLGKMF